MTLQVAEDEVVFLNNNSDSDAPIGDDAFIMRIADYKSPSQGDKEPPLEGEETLSQGDDQRPQVEESPPQHRRLIEEPPPKLRRLILKVEERLDSDDDWWRCRNPEM